MLVAVLSAAAKATTTWLLVLTLIILQSAPVMLLGAANLRDGVLQNDNYERNTTYFYKHLNQAIQCWADMGFWVESGNSEHHHKIVEKSCLEDVRYSEKQCSLSNIQNSSHFRYNWQVDRDKCPHKYHDWKSSAMLKTNCSMLDKQSIMVVGDSISEEFYFSLLSALWGSSNTGNCNPSFPKTVYCTKENGDQGSFSVSNVRNDYLLMNTEIDEGECTSK